MKQNILLLLLSKMKYNFSLFGLLLFCVSPLLGQNPSSSPEEEDLVISLSTETSLIPTYITDIVSSQTTLSESYLKQLKKVLEFDFDENGMTQLVQDSPDKRVLTQKEQNREGINAGAWKDLNVFYVIKPVVQGHNISVRIYSVNQPIVKETKDIALTGDLSIDRRKMHFIADTLFKSLFNRDGIASTKILYTVKLNNTDPTASAKEIAEVWQADYDGANARQITHENRLCVTPSYVPPKPGFTSGLFFYVCYRSAQPKIYLASIKDGFGEPLTSLSGNQLMPTTSPQRNYVAFISDVAGNPDLFIQPFNPDTGTTGKARQIFAAVNGAQGSPSFSPDGNHIAFVSNKDGNPRIYTMEIPPVGTSLKETKTTLISKKNKENTSPAWSPDGTRIAYSSMTAGTRQIWTYDLGSRKETQLTQGPTNKENPSWAPDSLHLVFNSDSPELGRCELYIMNLTSGDAKKITSGPGEKRFPSWELRTQE